MSRQLYKYTYYSICAFFIIELFAALALRDHVKNELILLIINYGFWFSFGLLFGFSVSSYIIRFQNKNR